MGWFVNEPEIIPVEPDPDNAGEGILTYSFPTAIFSAWKRHADGSVYAELIWPCKAL